MRTGSVIAILLLCRNLRAEISPADSVFFLGRGVSPELRLHHGANWKEHASGKVLEFTSALQFAEVEFSRKLDGAKAASVGGWFFPYRSGEQYFIFRGIPEINELGNRLFPRKDSWVNFVLGTDQHGFLMGTIHGNGTMPFPHVTVNEVAFDTWHQLVVVKSGDGTQKFYEDGVLVHSDARATSRGKAWPFVDQLPGEPLRLAMQQGGLVGEAWVFARELSAKEIGADFEAGRRRFKPALPGHPVELREMDQHPADGLWNTELNAGNWAAERARIGKAALQILGPFPKEKVPLEPQIHSETDCGTYVRRKVSIQVQAGDRMPAYLLIPKNLRGRVPAIICFYGTTSGAGKDTTVGMSGRAPGTPPERNASFAIDMAEAGFVAFAADYLRDGERVRPGQRPYDTTEFYREFPDWSIHGKDIWDNMRAVDYLQSLDFVDAEKIGMTGHSYGGHSTIFTAAFEPRIQVVVANGPVSDFLHHGMHWGVPKGGGNSQSMPGLRPYVLDHTMPLPVTFYEFTSLIAPRPLLVGQAAGERRPMEEENYAAVAQVYRALGAAERVRYHWYAGDHDYPPEARRAAVEWFRKWFGQKEK